MFPLKVADHEGALCLALEVQCLPCLDGGDGEQQDIFLTNNLQQVPILHEPNKLSISFVHMKATESQYGKTSHEIQSEIMSFPHRLQSPSVWFLSGPVGPSVLRAFDLQWFVVDVFIRSSAAGPTSAGLHTLAQQKEGGILEKRGVGGMQDVVYRDKGLRCA